MADIPLTSPAYPYSKDCKDACAYGTCGCSLPGIACGGCCGCRGVCQLGYEESLSETNVPPSTPDTVTVTLRPPDDVYDEPATYRLPHRRMAEWHASGLRLLVVATWNDRGVPPTVIVGHECSVFGVNPGELSSALLSAERWLSEQSVSMDPAEVDHG